MLLPGLTALLLVMPAAVTAGEILTSSVTHAGARYDLAITARIDAPVDAVLRAITDYSNLAAINPDIAVSELLGTTPDGVSTVRTVINVCILVFCRQVERLQRVTYPRAGVIEAVIIPDGSDFRSGFARWQLTSTPVMTTEMQFTETFEPDFWVPPLIGPWLIQRKLVGEVAETVMYIEAQQAAGTP